MLRARPQRKTILSLIEYYKKGELEEYNRYSIHWVGDTEPVVDFINGFTESILTPSG